MTNFQLFTTQYFHWSLYFADIYFHTFESAKISYTSFSIPFPVHYESNVVTSSLKVIDHNYFTIAMLVILTSLILWILTQPIILSWTWIFGLL